MTDFLYPEPIENGKDRV